MRITTNGGTMLQKNIVEEVCFWSGKKLMGRLSNNIDIDIHIKRLRTADAWCRWEDDHIRPREFSIDIRTGQRHSELILTVCHEMVHVKQMARGELCYVLYEYTWKGEKISAEIDYDDYPWEKEAYRLQLELAEQFVNDTNFSYTEEMIKGDRNKKTIPTDSVLANEFKDDSKKLEAFMKRAQ